MTCVRDGQNTNECPDREESYILIIAYAVTKFLSDFLNYLREIPFTYISANAEKHVATTVFKHIQN
jgi:hypothetical protein